MVKSLDLVWLTELPRANSKNSLENTENIPLKLSPQFMDIAWHVCALHFRCLLVWLALWSGLTANVFERKWQKKHSYRHIYIVYKYTHVEIYIYSHLKTIYICVVIYILYIVHMIYVCETPRADNPTQIQLLAVSLPTGQPCIMQQEQTNEEQTKWSLLDMI